MCIIQVHCDFQYLAFSSNVWFLPVWTSFEANAYSCERSDYVHQAQPAHGPCWSASLSTGESNSSSSGSTATVTVKHSFSFRSVTRCSRLCFLHVRGTVGLRTHLFWYMCGSACTANSCHGPINLDPDEGSKKWVKIQLSELLRLHHLRPCVYRWGCDLGSCLPCDKGHLWYSFCIPPATSGVTVTSLNLSSSTKEWGQNGGRRRLWRGPGAYESFGGKVTTLRKQSMVSALSLAFY